MLVILMQVSGNTGYLACKTELFQSHLPVMHQLGLTQGMLVIYGHQTVGKTHCNWVSPHLQLYFQEWWERARVRPCPHVGATKFKQ